MIPSSFFIQAQDLETHGYSAGCPGCVSILKRTKNRRPHSKACRRRLEELLTDTDKVKAADERKTEAIARMLEKADEEREAKRAKSGKGVEMKTEDKDMRDVELDKGDTKMEDSQ